MTTSVRPSKLGWCQFSSTSETEHVGTPALYPLRPALPFALGGTGVIILVSTMGTHPTEGTGSPVQHF